jgi:hypothetical protein
MLRSVTERSAAWQQSVARRAICRGDIQSGCRWVLHNSTLGVLPSAGIGAERRGGVADIERPNARLRMKASYTCMSPGAKMPTGTFVLSLVTRPRPVEDEAPRRPTHASHRPRHASTMNACSRRYIRFECMLCSVARRHSAVHSGDAAHTGYRIENTFSQWWGLPSPYTVHRTPCAFPMQKAVRYPAYTSGAAEAQGLFAFARAPKVSRCRAHDAPCVVRRAPCAMCRTLASLEAN